VATAIGQLQARFFFEAYLWLRLAPCGSFVVAEAIGVSGLVAADVSDDGGPIYSAANLFPAAVSASQREAGDDAHGARLCAREVA